MAIKQKRLRDLAGYRTWLSYLAYIHFFAGDLITPVYKRAYKTLKENNIILIFQSEKRLSHLRMSLLYMVLIVDIHKH
jgi:hypothetical protein